MRPAAPSNLAVPPDPSSPLRRREGPAMRGVWRGMLFFAYYLDDTTR